MVTRAGVNWNLSENSLFWLVTLNPAMFLLARRVVKNIANLSIVNIKKLQISSPTKKKTPNQKEKKSAQEGGVYCLFFFSIFGQTLYLSNRQVVHQFICPKSSTSRQFFQSKTKLRPNQRLRRTEGTPASGGFLVGLGRSDMAMPELRRRLDRSKVRKN